MTDLAVPLHRLKRRLARYEDTFRRHVLPRQLSRDVNWLLLGGLVSATWQSWCLFCRQLIIASSLGCRTRSGVLAGPCVVPATWERVSYVARQVKNRGRVRPGLTNAVLRSEPTWGDVVGLVDVIRMLAPGNQTQMISTFSRVTRGPIHVQTVRNATAHLNPETFAEVLSLRPYYVSRPIRHPSEAAFWMDASGAYAMVAWLDELRAIAEDASR